MGWTIQYYSDSTLHTSYQRPVNVLKYLIRQSVFGEGGREGGRKGGK